MQKRSFSLIVVLIVFILLLGLPKLTISPVKNTTIPTLDWTPVVFSSSGFDTTGLSFSPMDLTGMSFLDPGDCDKLRALGISCDDIKVTQAQTSDGERIIRVEAKSVDGHTAFRGETVSVSADSFPGLASRIDPATLAKSGGTAWVSDIQVANCVRGAGLGRLCWEILNRIVSQLYNEQQIFFFVDLAHWARSLLTPEKVEQIASFFTQGVMTYAYLAR